MEGILSKLKNVSLSDKDIRNCLKGRTRILLYSDVEKAHSLDQIFAGRDTVVILYLLHGHNNGHWVCLLKRAGYVEYFDPYGHKPDHYILTSKDWRQKNGGHVTPHLSKLLIEAGKSNVKYNHVALQRTGTGISTCGRWVIIRIMFKLCSLEEFLVVFGKKSITLNRDQLVVLLTFFCGLESASATAENGDWPEEE